MKSGLFLKIPHISPSSSVNIYTREGDFNFIYFQEVKAIIL